DPNDPSAPRASVPSTMDEKHFEEIDVAMLYLEQARSRAEQSVKKLKAADAEPHLIEALERTERELSESARKLRQGTFFAVPSAQTAL
ncbi:MAG: hypothetical protein M3355_05215, partial [Actinomycetota bacterium]|nr:hypothetical protein [Actinomycetota bacterium]